MLTIEQFIAMYGIKPADAVIMTKKFFGMLDHYVIYLGKNRYRNEHEFVANYTEGVKVIPKQDLEGFLKVLQPKEIEKFPGNEFERIHAVKRARSRIGEKAYKLFSNNCEHFKNWVHHGIASSDQVESLGKTFATVGLTAAAVGAVKGNDTLVGVGIIAAILGGIAIASEKND